MLLVGSRMLTNRLRPSLTKWMLAVGEVGKEDMRGKKQWEVSYTGGNLHLASVKISKEREKGWLARAINEKCLRVSKLAL